MKKLSDAQIEDLAWEHSASATNIEPDFVKAVVHVESGGVLSAIRYEPHYKWLWDVRNARPYTVSSKLTIAPDDFRGRGYCSGPTEFHMQKTSWGLMQIMGAVAREAGFEGTYLSELTDVHMNMKYGVQHLLRMAKRFKLNPQRDFVGIATAFNTGSPKDESHPYWKKIKKYM